MKQPTGQTARLTALRVFVQKSAFVALAGLAFAFMLLGKADTVLVERVRATVIDAAAPVLDFMSTPAENVAAIFANLRQLTSIRAENDRLATENDRLMRWQAAARHLEAENEALRGLLTYVPEPKASYVTARVVADTGGTFARSLVVLAGTIHGVNKGQAVISGEGLAGTVAEAGQRSSRVLLLTDINSRIPVLLEDSRVRAILAGDNQDRPQLRFLRDRIAVQPGDRVVTSGDARIFPPGIPIGVVASVDEKKGIRVDLFVEQDRLEVVRIANFGIPNPLSEGAD
ncbi:rod shape-determining protein MreC [Rhodospirillum rubrum]|uniref:Cell shape-determining protein MreC n=1 Tax=Rhodospirillum rubrum (strain ATCC 11170 / ATH 1.1.1 / DSM 467 / LMG 4362 / NCIMB 8255 / S1) TaxID=269796 RepID=Q2RX69_RHORT|nr:rod shape-determining protein MreC [Rhodospirillum rubrum]ABC21276.1 rod shape-determining protein MreC [Rhodospirillum rubrum ATCC 11170]AEO46954.1 rod shape-determining protein MreC [Rhodospirillum rubrum F11]MBK5952830.1 rod shape-determining protein MreC [Rhodospirillum rubrum]QXG80961.1 rod shape-determining protein MreC [Rhodospirillum rubrum]HAQ00813.1 rod shape-determining protein MreC [Rhodospirillum rubrum]